MAALSDAQRLPRHGGEAMVGRQLHTRIFMSEGRRVRWWRARARAGRRLRELLIDAVQQALLLEERQQAQARIGDLVEVRQRVVGRALAPRGRKGRHHVAVGVEVARVVV